MYYISYTNSLACLWQHSFQAQKSFIRYLSHEMRNPLNTAHLGLKLLRDDFNRVGDNQRLETVEDIRVSLEKAIVTLNEVLILDKLSSGSLVIEAEYLSASGFIEGVLRPFRVQVVHVQHQYGCIYLKSHYWLHFSRQTQLGFNCSSRNRKTGILAMHGRFIIFMRTDINSLK